MQPPRYDGKTREVALNAEACQDYCHQQHLIENQYLRKKHLGEVVVLATWRAPEKCFGHHGIEQTQHKQSHHESFRHQ